MSYVVRRVGIGTASQSRGEASNLTVSFLGFSLLTARFVKAKGAPIGGSVGPSGQYSPLRPRHFIAKSVLAGRAALVAAGDHGAPGAGRLGEEGRVRRPDGGLS